jgi:WXG100 family type VII secretion target
MGIISVTPEQLKEQATVYIRAKEGIEAQLQAVTRMNGQIGEQWKGQAFQSYLEQFNQLSAQVKKFEELLANINQQLNKYAQTIQDRDQTDASSFGLN